MHSWVDRLMPTVVVDNDILHKGAGYGLLQEFLSAIPAQLHEVGILGAAKYVVRYRLKREKLDAAASTFEGVIEQMQQLEPTAEEAQFAAQLEFEAQRMNLNIDVGESILCAITIIRTLERLVSGDKRAIGGFEGLAKCFAEFEKLKGKVICLEQLLVRLLETNAGAVRQAICGQTHLDRALTVCFSCSNPEVDPASWADGLASYIHHLRNIAPSILTP